MKVYPLQKLVLKAGLVCALLVLLFPPWVWSTYGGYPFFLDFEDGEPTSGIVWGIGWWHPRIFLDAEYDYQVDYGPGSPEAIKRPVKEPEGFYISTSLLFFELLAISILTIKFFCKAWEYEKAREVEELQAQYKAARKWLTPES